MESGPSNLASRSARRVSLRVLSMVVCLALSLRADLCRSQSLLEELTTQGLTFREGVQIKLPAPALAGQLSEEQRTAAKKQLAGNDDWERFTRDSVVAPVTIKLEYVTDSAGTRVGHNVHSAFVVHAKLESLQDKDLMQQIFGKPESSNGSGMKVTELSEADLRDAGVTVEKLETGQPRTTYSQIEFVLLDKILLRGVLRTERTAEPGSITIAWQLDPKFASNPKWQGTWTKVGETGTASHPYTGWGGFLNVTHVSEAPEMLLFESRMLLHEPSDWFSASNFVRSKLPLAIQEGARNFRRKLKAE